MMSAGASSGVGAAPSPAAPSSATIAPDQIRPPTAAPAGEATSSSTPSSTAPPIHVRPTAIAVGVSIGASSWSIAVGPELIQPAADSPAAEPSGTPIPRSRSAPTSAGPQPGEPGERRPGLGAVLARRHREEGRGRADQPEQRGEDGQEPVPRTVQHQGGGREYGRDHDRQAGQAGKGAEQRDDAGSEQDRERPGGQAGRQGRDPERLGRDGHRPIGMERPAQLEQGVAEVGQLGSVRRFGLEAGVDREAEGGRQLRPRLAEALDRLADRPRGRGGADPGDRVEAGPELVEGEAERVDVGGSGRPPPRPPARGTCRRACRRPGRSRSGSGRPRASRSRSRRAARAAPARPLTLRLRAGRTRTLSGLRSRWMTPASWAWARAEQSSAPSSATSRSETSPRAASSRRFGPSTSSLTR